MVSTARDGTGAGPRSSGAGWVAEHQRCGFYAEDRVVGLDPPYTDARAEFIRGKDGSVEWLRFASRIHKHVN